MVMSDRYIIEFTAGSVGFSSHHLQDRRSQSCLNISTDRPDTKRIGARATSTAGSMWFSASQLQDRHSQSYPNIPTEIPDA